MDLAKCGPSALVGGGPEGVGASLVRGIAIPPREEAARAARHLAAEAGGAS